MIDLRKNLWMVLKEKCLLPRTKILWYLPLLLLNVADLAGQTLPVIPQPQVAEVGKGNFRPAQGPFTLRVAAGDTAGLMLPVSQLQQAFALKFQTTPGLIKQGQPTIWMGLPEEDQDFKAHCQNLKIWPENRLGEEGYALLIRAKQIVLAAKNKTGLFYGVQTLKQLLRGYPAENTVPQLKIVDWPSLKYRAVMDDISRGPVPTLAFLKSQVRRFSELKINMMNYYVEHVVSTQSHGGFAPADGSISIREWKELADYADAHHIELVGSFQSLGHFSKILSHPRYRELGQTHRMLIPGDPKSTGFIKDVIKEMLPAFNSGFFNVFGDEAWDLVRGRSGKLPDSISIGRLYANHMLPIYKALKQQGKRMMLTADMPIQYPEIFEIIPKDVMMLTWDYGARESFADWIDPVKKAGFEFLVCPGVLNSNRLMPDFDMTVANIRNFVNEGKDKGAAGVFNTVWDDGGRHFFSKDWYGVAYGADQSWNPNRLPTAQFDKRFDRAVYGDESGGISAMIHELNKMSKLAPTQEMNNNILWNTLIPERGDRINLNTADWQEVLNLTQKSESLLNQAKTTSYEDDLPFWQFTIDQYQYLANSRMHLLKAADQYRESVLLQKSNPAYSRELLIDALNEVITAKTDLVALVQTLEILWLRENRSYWLDHAKSKYTEKIDHFTALQSLLVAAIEDFDKGLFLPPPTEVRLAISEVKGQYFQYWLLAGSFTINKPEGRKPDFLTGIGGEQKARPAPGMSFKGKNGEVYSWMKYNSPRSTEINLKQVFEKNTEVLAYAYCTIESPGEQEVRVTVGSNDGIEVICNGNSVFQKFAKRSLIPDEDEFMLPLKAGKNHVLLKIDQWQAGWGFSFRLPDHLVRNHKHKYKLLE